MATYGHRSCTAFQLTMWRCHANPSKVIPFHSAWTSLGLTPKPPGTAPARSDTAHPQGQWKTMITTQASTTSFFSQQTINFAKPWDWNGQLGTIRTLDSRQRGKWEAMKAALRGPINSTEKGSMEVYKLKWIVSVPFPMTHMGMNWKSLMDSHTETLSPKRGPWVLGFPAALTQNHRLGTQLGLNKDPPPHHPPAPQHPPPSSAFPSSHINCSETQSLHSRVTQESHS